MTLPDGYSDVPPGKIAAVVTHLEMTGPGPFTSRYRDTGGNGPGSPITGRGLVPRPVYPHRGG